MAIVSSSIIPVNPSTLLSDGFELADQSIIPNENIVGSFDPSINLIEFFAYDNNKNLISADYNFTNWKTIDDPTIALKDTLSTLELDPIEDLITRDLTVGDFYTTYNFISLELSSSINEKYFISEISPDRTELRIQNNILTDIDVEISTNALVNKINLLPYFDEFYLNLGNDEYIIGTNIQLDITTQPYTVLIKLYEPLPPQISVKDELYIVSKVAETQAYKVSFINEEEFLDDVKYIKGPNINLDIKDFINNSTNYKTKSELLQTSSTGSLFQLQSIMNKKGVSITPNYSIDTFNEFIHFSSVKKRILNFVDKVSKIQTYENDIYTITANITGPTSSSLQVSSSIASLNTNIENIIKNFDGYEYFLYYTSGSDSYPKSNNISPYILYPTTSSVALTWIGNDVENSQYYGGIILSASVYDNNNQDYLYYIIPEFIRENSDNDQYIEFVDMMGQHFDEIWLYTKAVTSKLNSTNVLDKGAPTELVSDIITSFGYEPTSNNYDNYDNYIAYLGINPDGGFTPPTGSEMITDYIAINDNGINEFPYAIDDVSKEIFKRLYHNLVYLAKKKGTISGLRQLINIWGVPDTILRINEFGGKNKDQINDYDAWYNRYSYAYTPSLDYNNDPKSTIKIPWALLQSNITKNTSDLAVPDNIEFRFKTPEIPTGSYISQSLLLKKSNGDASPNFDFGIQLIYSGSTSLAPYSGSSINNYSNYGVIRFYISGSPTPSNDIYLPFFDGGWWSIMLQRDTHVDINDNNQNTTYTLYAKNKIYNGYDGNQIGFKGSSSLFANTLTSGGIQMNESWNKLFTSSFDGLYLGGYISGSIIGGNTMSTIISPNSFQEFRYYNTPITETTFDDYVMNPESIMGLDITGSLSSFNILSFRAPLGNELENITSSFHPSSNASSPLLITSSFYFSASNTTSSKYEILYYNNVATSSRYFTETNVETYYLDQPALGIRNAINNKIQIEDNNSYGNVLSMYSSIQQNYSISKSYTEDINNLEVSFSPQDEINDDIIQTFGPQPLSDAFSDPRDRFSSLYYYPKLRNISDDYFKKYSKGNIYDYMRLIKYFDNSLFKSIKNYVPARTSVSTGIVIKQHLLERNRYRVPQIDTNTTLTNIFNVPYVTKDLTINAQLEVGSSSGGTGGSIEKYNYSGSPDFYQGNITQSWDNSFDTPFGIQTIIENTQKEFYNGEYSGSSIVAENGELNPANPFKYSNNTPTIYNIHQFFLQSSDFLNCSEITFVNDAVIPSPSPFFPNISTIPQPGDIMVWSNSTPFSPSLSAVKYIKIHSLDTNNNNNNNTLINVNIVKITGINYNIINRQKRGDFWLFTIDESQPSNPLNAIQDNTIPNEMIILTPLSPPGISFENSDYNATINNYNENRKNSSIMDVDYSTNINTPSNFNLILSGSANRTSTPDSNYTSRRVIYPRYEGSKNSSANYNYYTPSGNTTFLNGSTGSWSGDSSPYGKVAAIDHYPIYFSHFKTSHPNLEIFNTTTFDVDMLIEVPQNNIQGTNYQPRVIKLDGSNNNLYITSNNFEKNRQTSIIFNNPSGSINSNALSVGTNTISQGGLEYQLLCGNEISQTSYVSTCSFTNSNWASSVTQDGVKLNSVNFVIDYGKDYYLKTGSFSFQLAGGFYSISSSINQNPGDTSFVFGPGLGLIHSYNHAVKNQTTASINLSYNTSSIGIPKNTSIDPNQVSNYIRFIPTASGMDQYQNFNTPFLLEYGDEIRITWQPNSSISLYKSQDFTITEITSSATTINNDYFSIYVSSSILYTSSILSNSVLDIIKVTPDPTLLSIPSGSITNFTIRKRVEADDRVIIFQTTPMGSQGILSPSNDGFLIPNDFSEIQKRNTLTLINQLKDKNAFSNN